MSRLQSERPPMTPAECRQDSRAVLYWQVERAVEAGTPLVAIARRPGMPKRATLERWRDNDERMRARHIAAIERQRMVLAEEFVIEADARAEHAHGRRRVAALRTQIAARTRLLRLLADQEKKAANAATVPRETRGDAPRESSSLPRTPEPAPPQSASFPRTPAPSSSSRTPAPASFPRTRESSAQDSASRDDTTDTPVTVGATPSASPAPLSPSSSPKGEDPRVSFRHSRESGSPESPVEASQTKNLDPRLRGDDENKHDASSTSPTPPTAANDDNDAFGYAVEDARYRAPPARPLNDSDDGLAYAIEDARYRPARRHDEPAPPIRHSRAPLCEGPRASGPMDGSPEPQTEELDSQLGGRIAPRPLSKEGRGNDEDKQDVSSVAPPAPEPAPPLLPPVELDEDGEPRFHRLPLTVGEEEALKARLAGKPLPPEEKKSPWKPDGPTYVRFDVGGGFDVSNRRSTDTTWSDYDPLDWGKE